MRGARLSGEFTLCDVFTVVEPDAKDVLPGAGERREKTNLGQGQGARRVVRCEGAEPGRKPVRRGGDQADQIAPSGSAGVL
jgi:hypothetical protein